MADLKTNYIDDILNSDVNTRRKYRMIQNDDGTVSFEDATDYSQVGDSFGGADINKTNEAVNDLVNGITAVGMSKKLETIRNLNGVEFDGSSDFSNYGVSSSGVSTATKTVTINGFVLTTGANIRVKFNNSNSSAAPKLNVNGLTPNAEIRYAGTRISYTWSSGSVLDLTYDGKNWQVNNLVVATTTYYGICKLIDNLNSTVATNGYALSAHQGYLLDARTPYEAFIGTLSNLSNIEITVPSNKVKSLMDDDCNDYGYMVNVAVFGSIKKTDTEYEPLAEMVSMIDGSEVEGSAEITLHNVSAPEGSGKITIEYNHSTNILRISGDYYNVVTLNRVLII